jgi:hypothetical protein
VHQAERISLASFVEVFAPPLKNANRLCRVENPVTKHSLDTQSLVKDL